MAVAMRRDRASKTGSGFLAGDMSMDVVRRIQKWKTKAVKALEQKREARATRVMRRQAERVVELEDFWLNVTLEELMTWSLRELRVALASRDLDQIGTRAQLIDRVLQQQRRDLKRVARAEALEKLQRERRGEAKGVVMGFGIGYGPEQHCWDRLFVRGSPSVMQALCGRGVVQVSCAFDGRVALCLTESGDVISFGGCTPEQGAPLGYPDSKSRRARGNRREEMFISDRAPAAGAAQEALMDDDRMLLDEGGDDASSYARDGLDSREASSLRSSRRGTSAGGSSRAGGSARSGRSSRAGGSARSGRSSRAGGAHRTDGSLRGVDKSLPPLPGSESDADTDGHHTDAEDGSQADATPNGTASGAVVPFGGEFTESLVPKTDIDAMIPDELRPTQQLPLGPLESRDDYSDSEYEYEAYGQIEVPLTRVRPRGATAAHSGPGETALAMHTQKRPGSTHDHPRGARAEFLKAVARPGGGGGEWGGFTAGAKVSSSKGRRPSMSAPVGLEPLHSSDDDSVGRMMVKRATAGPENNAAPPLPLQPMFERIENRAGAGNYPSGGQAPNRRVAVRRVVDPQSGPGGEAAKAAIKDAKRADREMEAKKKADNQAQLGMGKLTLMKVRDRFAGTSADAGADGTDGDGADNDAHDDLTGLELEEQLTTSKQRLTALRRAKKDKLSRQRERKRQKAKQERRDRRAERRAMLALEAGDPELDGEDDAGGEAEGSSDSSGVDDFADGTTETGSKSKGKVSKPMTRAQMAEAAAKRKDERRRRRAVDRVGWSGAEGYAKELGDREEAVPGANDRSGVRATAAGARTKAVTLTRRERHDREQTDGDLRLPSIGSSGKVANNGDGGGRRARMASKAAQSLRVSKSTSALSRSIPGGPTSPRDASVPWVTKRDRKRWKRRGEAALAGDVAGAARSAAAERKRIEALGASAGGAATMAEGEGLAEAWTMLPPSAQDAAVETELRRRGVIANDAPPSMRADDGGGTYGAYGASGGALVPTTMGTRERLFALGSAAAKTAAGRGDGVSGKARLLPLSQQPLREPGGEGISRVVTPRTALKHSLLLRRFGPVGEEGEEYTHEELRKLAAGGVRPTETGAGASAQGSRGVSGGRLAPGGSGAGFAITGAMPAGLEEDPDDPYWAEYDAKTREPWWDMSVGGLERAKHADAIRLAQRGDDIGVVGGALSPDQAADALEAVEAGISTVAGGSKQPGSVAAAAAGGGGGGWKAPEAVPVNPAQYGGQHNYRDIERAVDADMRGYGEWAPPTEVRELRGECVLLTAVSRNHGAAVSSGGDVFVWGSNPAGQHGMAADGAFKPFPALIDSREMLGLPAGGRVVSAAVGPLHSAFVTDQGELLVAGASSMGRLGLGGVRAHGPPLERAAKQRRIGAAPWAGGNLAGMDSTAEGRAAAGSTDSLVPAHVTVPVPVPFFSIAAAAAAGKLAHRRRVLKASCGAAHTVVITDRGVYSWGSGAGGRLGIGRPKRALAPEARSADIRSKNGSTGRVGVPAAATSSLDRPLPTLIKGLQGEIVLDAVASSYHTLFLVQVPPLQEGGWVYACGTGTVGQLGLLDTQAAWEPRLMESLVEKDVVAVEITCGVYHCAALSTEGEVWTWGSAAGNCLGRPAQLSAAGYPAFTPLPGRAEGLREFGVGPVISVACGDRCTFVVTAPYNPGAWPDWKQEEMEAIDASREKRSNLMQELMQEEVEDRYRLAMERSKLEQQRIHQLNRTRPLCVLAPPGSTKPEPKQGRASIFGALTRRGGLSGREMDAAAEAAEDRSMVATLEGSSLGANTGRSTAGDGTGKECTGFIPRLFAQEVCDVCGYHRKHHKLLRRVPPVEELVQGFMAEIQEEEEDAATNTYQSARRQGQSARSSARQ